MNKLTKLACLSLFLLFSASISSAAPKDYRYTTVPNDPLKARIYTLDNGLKVYMTVNKETPRIQTYIAVRVGGKNDPAETTGLAHYFEHLMFKGTTTSVHRTMKQNVRCSTGLNNNLKCIAKQRMKLSAKPSIMLSTVCHTKLQNMPFPMNMTN